MCKIMRIKYSSERGFSILLSKISKQLAPAKWMLYSVLLACVSGCANLGQSYVGVPSGPAVIVDGVELTSALYFNEKNELIQMEDTRGVNLSGRTLLNITNPPPNPTNKPTYPCPGNGVSQSLQSPLIKFAIYYGVAKDGSGADVRKAYKWEQIPSDLQRKIKCQKSPFNQCPAPKRCITTCAGAPNNCPQYCCIY